LGELKAWAGGFGKCIGDVLAPGSNVYHCNHSHIDRMRCGGLTGSLGGSRAALFGTRPIGSTCGRK
jgi:hypothetical protein